MEETIGTIVGLLLGVLIFLVLNTIRRRRKKWYRKIFFPTARRKVSI